MIPPCTAAMPCPDNSSLNINEFVGEGFAFLIGVLLAELVYEWLQRRRKKRQRLVPYDVWLDAVRNVTPSVYEEAPGGAQTYEKPNR